MGTRLRVPSRDSRGASLYPLMKCQGRRVPTALQSNYLTSPNRAVVDTGA